MMTERLETTNPWGDRRKLKILLHTKVDKSNTVQFEHERGPNKWSNETIPYSAPRESSLTSPEGYAFIVTYAWHMIYKHARLFSP